MDCISPASGAMDAAVLRQKIRYAAGSATAETIGDRAEGQAAVRMLWGNAAGILLDAARHFAERTAVLEAHEVRRSEEHTSELQSLMRTSYAVFCLKKKKQKKT